MSFDIPMSELAMSSFSGVLVGALSALVTIPLCLIGKRAVGLLDDYLRLSSERMEFWKADRSAARAPMMKW